MICIFMNLHITESNDLHITESNDLHIIVLAGGMGKRMQSDLPKVLHEIDGKPMIISILEKAIQMLPKHIYVVVRPNYAIIQNKISEYISHNITYIVQPIANGTGSAVKAVINLLPNDDSPCMILNGDTPLISLDTMKKLNESFTNYDLQITAINLDNPYGHGRIIVEDNKFKKIVEEKDCNELEKQIKLSNTGIYMAKTSALHQCIPKIQNNNAQQEYYLTDIVQIANNMKMNIGLYILPSEKWIEIYNINTKEQLEYVRNK